MRVKGPILKNLNKYNFMAQQHYIITYRFSIYKEKLNNFFRTDKYFKKSISIPVYVSLNAKAQNKNINTNKNYFN